MQEKKKKASAKASNSSGQSADIGPSRAQEIQEIRETQTELPFEIEQFAPSTNFKQGKLCECLAFWRNINCSNFVLLFCIILFIENGYKILFDYSPSAFNRRTQCGCDVIICTRRGLV